MKTATAAWVVGVALGASSCNDDPPSRADACKQLEQRIARLGTLEKEAYDRVLPRTGKRYAGHTVDELEAGAQRRIDRAVAQSFDRCLALSDADFECVTPITSGLDDYFAKIETCGDDECREAVSKEMQSTLGERCMKRVDKVYCQWPGKGCAAEVPRAR